ncbi:MAG: 30S ribosomal protein S8 [Phycisphaerales bacterium]|jgi:small subunit ribosomal protein S8|nr:30S ribosomal protein S8 [Phycisphaerales bacterium]NUQ66883.1 30S ribosomal protein S8 [Phycisphaerales bacterium]
MAIGDPIADMLTRIRNATSNKAKTVTCLNSKVCRGIADVLRDEGYVDGYDVIEDGRQGLIKVRLKYGPGGETLMHKIQRMSKPGRRVYNSVDAIPRPMQGLGIAIVSTSMGVLSDRKAREAKVGGELLCVIE